MRLADLSGEVSLLLVQQLDGLDVVCVLWLLHWHLTVQVCDLAFKTQQLPLLALHLNKVKASSYIAQYPVLRTVQSALHFTSLTDLFTQTPSRLLWEASSHMLQLMREGCSYIYPPLSMTRYSFIQLSELEQCRVKKLAQALSLSHCAQQQQQQWETTKTAVSNNSNSTEKQQVQYGETIEAARRNNNSTERNNSSSEKQQQ